MNGGVRLLFLTHNKFVDQTEAVSISFFPATPTTNIGLVLEVDARSSASGSVEGKITGTGTLEA